MLTPTVFFWPTLPNEPVDAPDPEQSNVSIVVAENGESLLDLTVECRVVGSGLLADGNWAVPRIKAAFVEVPGTFAADLYRSVSFDDPATQYHILASWIGGSRSVTVTIPDTATATINV